MNMLLSLAIAIKVVHILDGELNINGLRIPVRVDISQAAINAIKIKNLNTVMEILYNLMWLRYCVRELEMFFLLIALIDLFIVSVISWFRPHVTGRGNSHEIWHNLAMFHVLGSVLFPVAIIFHMATHWD